MYKQVAKAGYGKLDVFVLRDLTDFRIRLWDRERRVEVNHEATFISSDEAKSAAKALAVNYAYQEKGEPLASDFDYESLKLDWQSED
jgi:hypothetical protein